MDSQNNKDLKKIINLLEQIKEKLEKSNHDLYAPYHWHPYPPPWITPIVTCKDNTNGQNFL